MDLWADSAKANGRAKTFYWKHPAEETEYVVRFMSSISRVQTGRIADFRGVSSVSLRVEGIKA